MEKTPRDKNWSFVISSLAFALLILAALNVLKPVIAPDAREPELRALQREIIYVKAGELPARLKSAQGRDSFLFVYASWCGICRQVMPQLIAHMREGNLDAYNIIMLSVDSKPRDFAAYMVRTGYRGFYTPYVLDQSPFNPLKDTLRKLGSSYDNEIPYAATFDSQGRLIDEMGGISIREWLVSGFNN